jgi:hypothetical protein
MLLSVINSFDDMHCCWPYCWRSSCSGCPSPRATWSVGARRPFARHPLTARPTKPRERADVSLDVNAGSPSGHAPLFLFYYRRLGFRT